MNSHKMLLVGLILACSGPAYAQRVETRESDLQTPDGTPEADGARPDLSRVGEGIIERTNAFRAEQGRGKVRSDPELSAAARYFADYMARTGRYSHTADGNQPSARAEKHGYDYCLVSENIAYQYKSAGFEAEQLAEAFTQGWVDSPGHRKNMLDPDVTDTARRRTVRGSFRGHRLQFPHRRLVALPHVLPVPLMEGRLPARLLDHAGLPE
jgi:uncharacterized protein YkwD